jgi:hypothetical protein
MWLSSVRETVDKDSYGQGKTMMNKYKVTPTPPQLLYELVYVLLLTEKGYPHAGVWIKRYNFANLWQGSVILII